MATDVGSPQRFFHMPRFQHQAPRQVFYKRPDFAQQQAMQQLTFDGKRMRKAVNRKTIDYNPSVIRYLENRLWQRDHRDFRAIQPDAGFYNDLVPPIGMLSNPMNAVTTKFVRTSTNKVKCPVFVIRWTPEGRRLVTGASSGEFTLWNGLTFNFETILQAHDSPVRAMTWSHNDMWMLTADHGGYVKYWQSNMNNVKMFQAHKEAIREARYRGGGPGRPGGRGYPDDYGGQEEGFDGPEEMGRSWDSGGHGRPPRGGVPPRGGGHDGYRDGQQMHDGSTPTGRERPSSMQGMDMASLPPRKRPWQDGPGTGDPREHESERPDGGRPQREDGGYGPSGRGGRGGWGPVGGPRRGGPPPRGAPRGGRSR
uniref:WD repeat domain 33 n=1 Tax=Astatotilapia calliptera TaxID=8154 RepID=A0AAX7SYM1_ASTCA